MILIKRDDTSTRQLLSNISCFPKTCPQTSDWLTYEPNGLAGYILGPAFLVLGTWLVHKQQQHASLLPVAMNYLGMLELFFALMLRSSLVRSVGNKTAMYRASLFLGIHSSVFVLATGVVLVRHVYSAKRPHNRVLLWTFCFALVPTVLLAVGIGLMFGSHVSIGTMRLITAFGSVMLFGLVAAMLGFVCVLRRCRAPVTTRFIVVLSVVFLCLLTELAFVTVRSTLPLDNVARDSEALLYLFQFVPLILASLVLTFVDDNWPSGHKQPL
ncbi:hypothetical protein GGI25_003150 [Coemansia spiralis]|uniref:Uncharacterized protein n=2 Tax=Coemansia TaxID=4863 RepID=A0A9W8G721_9FUNG|nr:hypothetical protein EDC05_003232 [Coemansia umbellata]KAJ2621760.1 hypothetical protein GGI26_003855 [Coemansia sp. RSA 1358]KAJ2677515.1 hypothetical protein GGI25_003150 [Coemansia spiralis]